MRDAEYQFIRDLVYQRSRINLGPDKKELVSARLGKRLRATNITSISDYCRFLQERAGEEELSHLIDAISTNHTFFFREKAHFDFLSSHVLPEMEARRSKERWPQCAVWSAASSSGEEPYSIAISLHQFFQSRPGWPWRVEATDISHKILQKARVGVYRSDAVDKIDAPLLRTHFQKGFGPQEGFFRVKPTLQERVTFRQVNLLDAGLPFEEPFQVIFCRNVMIYFDRQTQEELVNKLTRALVPGGYLMVGHSESLTGIKHALQMVKPATYRRPLS
jgi:chemotaxis protein methyltransferase CheR